MDTTDLQKILLQENIPENTYNILGGNRYIRGESGLVLWKDKEFFVVSFVERNEFEVVMKTKDENQAATAFLKLKSECYPQLKKYLEK